MDDFDGQGNMRADDVGGGSQAVDAASASAPQISGGLLDPSSFPTDLRQPDSVVEQGPVVDAAPLGSLVQLDNNVHAEVLRDILDAQSKLASNGKGRDDEIVLNGQTYRMLKATTFDPARSNGLTSMPDDLMAAAGIAGAPTVTVPYGRNEELAYMTEFPEAPNPADADPKTGLISTLRMRPTVFMPSTGGEAGASGTADYASRSFPVNAIAGIHGHIDDGPPDPQGFPIRSDGMLDNTAQNGGFGDTQSLFLYGVPMATVSDGHVGWHGIDKGQLKFIYPTGSMTPSQVTQMQSNLNQEQEKFLRPK